MKTPRNAQTSTDRQRCAAIVLAGGHGRRAGGPKALKLLYGRPLWRVQARNLEEMNLWPTIAVLHPAAMDEVMRDVTRVQADPDASMFASLQAGLAAVPEGVPVIVHPVDAGLPSSAVVRALLRAYRRGGQSGRRCDVWQPRLDGGQQRGRRGHPLLLASQFWPHLLGLDAATARLDHVLAALADDRRGDLPWNDESILANFNRDGIQS